MEPSAPLLTALSISGQIANTKKGGGRTASQLPGMSMKKLCDFKYTLETKVVILSDNRIQYSGEMCRKYVREIKKT